MPEEKSIYEFLVSGKLNLDVYPNPKLRLEAIKAEYRNLRENYEYRLRYDEAGKFFVREMELKRNYRESDYKLEQYCLFLHYQCHIGF